MPNILCFISSKHTSSYWYTFFSSRPQIHLLVPKILLLGLKFCLLDLKLLLSGLNFLLIDLNFCPFSFLTGDKKHEIKYTILYIYTVYTVYHIRVLIMRSYFLFSRPLFSSRPYFFSCLFSQASFSLL